MNGPLAQAASLKYPPYLSKMASNKGTYKVYVEGVCWNHIGNGRKNYDPQIEAEKNITPLNCGLKKVYPII